MESTSLKCNCPSPTAPAESERHEPPAHERRRRRLGHIGDDERRDGAGNPVDLRQHQLDEVQRCSIVEAGCKFSRYTIRVTVGYDGRQHMAAVRLDPEPWTA